MKYTHWLQFGGMKIKTDYERQQWDHLKEYLEKYPDSNATVYLKDTGDVFARIIKLECSQNYNDLDLDCNSCFNGSIKHLNYKPNLNNLSVSKLEHFIKVMQ